MTIKSEAGVLSQREAAAILEMQLGHAVQVVAIAVWKQQARLSRLGDYEVETLVKMFFPF